MQICSPDPLKRTPPRSVIEAKNKIRLGHDECCNCCCCCYPQQKCYKYVQPEVPKSFAPIRYYWRANVPMEDNTTYKLSYWEGPPCVVDPIPPRPHLTIGEGPMSDETTHKMSYLGNWCVNPEPPITPCEKQWLGRGPMQDVTTQKHDFLWKCGKKADPIRAPDHIYTPCAALSDDTTYRLSYYPSTCTFPVESFRPIRTYWRSDVPMEGCTTYRLSYWPNEPMPKEDYPWANKGEYHPPVDRITDCTTYKLSYWPHSQEKRPLAVVNEADNILNAGCCFDENTTYRLSYFNCSGDKRVPIRKPGNISFSPCPLSHDTTHRLSYLGNWCAKPEPPITPCDKQLLGRGPMQDLTTQKHDFTWKSIKPPGGIRPEDSFVFSCLPLEACTTHRLSYLPNDPRQMVPLPNFRPIRSYWHSGLPMEKETTMRLSYQQVEPADQMDKPWSEPPAYHPPSTPVDDTTTYNLSYIPPGTLVPLPTCSSACPPPPCNVPPCQPCPAS